MSLFHAGSSNFGTFERLVLYYVYTYINTNHRDSNQHSAFSSLIPLLFTIYMVGEMPYTNSYPNGLSGRYASSELQISWKRNKIRKREKTKKKWGKIALISQLLEIQEQCIHDELKNYVNWKSDWYRAKTIVEFAINNMQKVRMNEAFILTAEYAGI